MLASSLQSLDVGFEANFKDREGGFIGGAERATSAVKVESSQV